MLTEEDLRQISELLKKQTEAFDKHLDEKLVKQKDEILIEVDRRLVQQLKRQKEEIVREVGDFIHDQLLPLFDAHDQRITRLEKHTNHPPIPAV